MPYNVIRLGTSLPTAKSRVELCHNRAKTVVWLQLTNTEFIIGGAAPVFVTALIGAVSSGAGWKEIDASTALQNRDMTYSFGVSLGDRIDDFQRAIVKDWATFDGSNPGRWAKGLTFGQDVSAPGFVMKAIKTGFDAIGVSVQAYLGAQFRAFTVDDCVTYLKRRASVVGADITDAALLDFEEVGPDPTLRLQEDPASRSDERKIKHIESKRKVPHGGRFAYPELTSAIPFKRVVTYGFRGDSRMPSMVKNAGGFNPNYTRPDQIKKAADDNSPQDKALDLPAFLANQFYGGYISVCRSYAVTKAFATGMGGTTPRASGWVYACLVEGGFIIPPAQTLPAKGKYPAITIPFNEQEISMPGLLDWEDVIACRRVNRKGVFEGNIFMRPSMKTDDPAAASTIWRLLSGETQGNGLVVR